MAAFVELLAHSGLLTPASARPSDIRRLRERSADRFQREMDNPANFGMAIILFARGPLPEAEAALEGIAELLKQLHVESPAAVRKLLDHAA